MSFEASIQIFGDTQFARELRFVGDRAYHAKPLYEELGWFMANVAREQFLTDGARSGQPWAPLAASTVKQKGHDTILVDSGALKESFKLWDAENVYEATDDYLRYGSLVDYGIFHQTGTEDNRGIRTRWPGTSGVIKRPPLELTEADRVHIVKMMQYWVRYGALQL